MIDVAQSPLCDRYLQDHSRIPVTQSEAFSLELIRTETVLSRLPVHNLAKQGRVNIQIIKTTPSGAVELKWEVSYSERYGQARQLAYKLDTIIVNQRIDEAGRPLPKLLRIGSLNEICAELSLATHAGENAKDLKRAFLQNASAFITAKFNYRANDGTERHVEAGVTRYGVIFTGEKLPDGRKADAVYISFNDPFWEVLNSAPVRPLDRAYMKQLPPAAQRFYEIISRKIFAALKNDYASAKISYSEYCTFSAQLRHFERQRVQDQMAKVLRPHKASGYITAIRYEPIIDAQNQPDWIMYLSPGPKARAEFTAAHTRRKILKHGDGAISDSGEDQPKLRKVERPVEPKIAPAPSQLRFDPLLISELTRRGINERMAHELLANLKPGQEENLLAQLEYAEQTVHQLNSTSQQVRNPAGFIISMIQNNATLPENFETSAQHKTRAEQERKEGERRVVEEARQVLRDEYDRYCSAETDRYIGEHPDIFAALKETKLKEEHQWSRGLSFTPSETIATTSAKWQIREQVPFLTFEEFLEHKKQGTDFLLKSVGSSLAEVPAATEPKSQNGVAEIQVEKMPSDTTALTTKDKTPMEPIFPQAEPIVQVASPEDLLAADEIRELNVQQTAEVEAANAPVPLTSESPLPEPMMIELVSDPPPNEVGGASAEQGNA